jgi:hypothetical protein
MRASAICTLEIRTGIAEAPHFIGKVSTVIRVVALQVIWDASTISASELIFPTPTENLIRSITTLVVTVANVTVIFASVVCASEIVDAAEAVILFISSYSGNIWAVSVSVTQPLTWDAHIRPSTLVLIVRAGFAEKFVRPVMAIVIVITLEIFVDAFTVCACELTMRTDPAVALIAVVPTVVVLIAHVDAKNTFPIRTLEFVDRTATRRFVTEVRTLRSTIAEPLICDTVPRRTFKLMSRTISR